MTDLRERTLVENLPESYFRESVEEAIRTSLALVDAKFRQVADRMDRFEQIPPPVGVVEEPEPLFGKVRKSQEISGTKKIPAPPNQAPLTSEELNVLPGLEDSILLNLAPNRNRDVWATTTSSGVDYVGPRRIWRVSRARQVPRAPQPTARYRLVVDGLRFGVISLRLLDELANVALNDAAQTGSRWEVSYGMVITGIPNVLGRKPVRATMDYGKNTPAAGVARNNGVLSKAWVNGTRDFYEPAADEFFSSAAGKAGGAYTAGAPVTNFLEPETKYVDTYEGFTVMLVTGETANEVYAQVNGLDSPNLPFIGGRPRGLNAIVPAFTESNSITCPSVTVALSAAEMETRTTSTFTTTDAVVEGVPFIYSDCQAMAYKGPTFSVALVIDPPRILEWNDISGASGIFAAPTDEMRPAMWHTTGVEIASGNERTMTLDLIVE